MVRRKARRTLAMTPESGVSGTNSGPQRGLAAAAVFIGRRPHRPLDKRSSVIDREHARLERHRVFFGRAEFQRHNSGAEVPMTDLALGP